MKHKVIIVIANKGRFTYVLGHINLTLHCLLSHIEVIAVPKINNDWCLFTRSGITCTASDY